MKFPDDFRRSIFSVEKSSDVWMVRLVCRHVVTYDPAKKIPREMIVGFVFCQSCADAQLELKL